MEMYLDNIHAEKVDKKYVEPTLPEKQTPTIPEATNNPSGTGIYYTDTANKVGVRYDFNGTVGLPGVNPGIYANNYYIVQSETENAIERVLYFYRLGIDTVDATGHEYIQLRGQAMNDEQLQYEHPVAIFEADMLFGGIPAFESVNGNYVVMMRITGQDAKADVYLSTDKNGNLKFIQAVESSHYVPLEQDKWYNMRFEFYTLDAEAKQGRIKVYVDGEFSIELDAVDFAVRSGSNANNVIIQLQKAGPEAYVMLDNVYIGHDNKEFEASREIVPEHYPADSILGTHDGGEIFNSTEEYAGIRVPVEPHAMKPVTAYGDYTGTYVGEDGYVYFYRAGKGGSQDFVKYTIDKAPELENLCFIYEADMALGRVDNGTTYFSQIRLNANGRNAHVYIHADENGKLYFNLMQGNAAATFTPLEQSEWYNIRLEFYFLSDEIYDGAIMVKAYVNGTFAADLVANGISESTYNRVLIYAQNMESDGYVALDNLFFGFVSKEYVAAEGVTVPTSPGTEEPGDTPDTPTTPEVTEPVESIYSPTGECGNGVLYSGEAVNGDTRYSWDNLTSDKPLSTSNTQQAITYMTKQGYMVFERVKGTTSQVNLNIPFGEAPNGKLGNIVEFDAAFFNVNNIFLQIALATSDGKVGQVYFTTSNGKIVLHSASIEAGENIAIEAEKWYNLRFEYWLSDTGELKVNLYINGSAAASFNAIEVKNGSSDNVKMTLRAYATETAILIDNLYTGFTMDAYEIPESIRPPEPPEITLPEILGTRGEGENAANSTTVNYNSATSAPSLTAPGRAELFSDADGDNFVWFGKWIYDEVANAQQSLSYSHTTRPTDALGNLLELDIAFGNFSEYTTTQSDRKDAPGFKIAIFDGKYMAEVYFYADDSGKIAIKESASPIISGKNIALDENTWYNLTLKSYSKVVDGNETRIFKLYVNGQYYCDIQGADVKSRTQNYTNLTLCQFEADDYVLVDNVYTGYHTEEYVDPGFRLNDFEGENAVVPPATSIKSGSGKYAVEFAIETFMNSNRLKVTAPKVYEGDTSLINNGNNEWSFYATGTELDANCAVWESDIIIAPDAATSGKIYTLNIRNASEVLLSFNIYLDGTALKLDNTYDLGSTNEEISLKLVYKIVEKEGEFYPSADVYVGDNLIATKTSGAAYEADAISISSLARVHMTSNPAADGYIYFDNYRFVKLYDESITNN